MVREGEGTVWASILAVLAVTLHGGRALPPALCALGPCSNEEAGCSPHRPLACCRATGAALTAVRHHNRAALRVKPWRGLDMISAVERAVHRPPAQNANLQA